MAHATKFIVRKQRMPLQPSFKFMANLSAPIPYLYEIPILTPNSPLSAIVPSIGKQFKFILASSKTIARWFGVTCEDCPNDSIWGCYVTKSCWKVAIVALGAIFLFIAFLMGMFFLGQIDDLLKYQKQLTEFEKAYPTLAKIMIFPLKQFHKMFTKSYDKTIKSLTTKFGTKPWFKFVVIMPCKCLKGTWTIFQKILQPTCFFTCNVCEKTKKYIVDIGFFQWATDKTLKKVGLRPDPEGDEKRAIKAKEKEKEAKIDMKKAKKQEKKVELQARKDERAIAKQAKLEAKASKKQAKIDARVAKREAQNATREARNDAKLDTLEETEEVKRESQNASRDARNFAKLDALEEVEKAKREAQNTIREARNDTKLNALKEVEETKRKAREARLEEEALEEAILEEEASEEAILEEEATEEAKIEAIEAVEEEKKDVEEKFVKDKVSKAPPPSPALPSPPFSPPPSPILPTTANPQGISPTTMVTPMVPPTTPTTPIAMVPLQTPTTPSTIIPQGMSHVTIIPAIVPSTMPPTSLGMIPLTSPIMTNQQTMYEVDSTQQDMDLYVTQQYGDVYNADSYEAYQTFTRQEAQVQGYGTYGQEHYGIYGNDPTYVQQGVYGQDQYEQQPMGYNYDTNVANNIANAQQQYQQQYNGPQYYG